MVLEECTVVAHSICSIERLEMRREENESTFQERRARRDDDSSYTGPERRTRRDDDSIYTGPERRTRQSKYPEDGLTPEERRYLRKMIEEDTRRKWLAKQALSVATWVAAVLIGITTVWDTLKNVIKAGSQ